MVGGLICEEHYGYTHSQLLWDLFSRPALPSVSLAAAVTSPWLELLRVTEPEHGRLVDAIDPLLRASPAAGTPI